MATEKQAVYITELITGLRIEKMEWVAKLAGLRKNHREFTIQKWIDSAMGTRDYDNEVVLEDTLNAYNARLNEIAENTEEMSAREASRAIDNLKNCIVAW